jgi:hypothetical protein
MKTGIWKYIGLVTLASVSLTCDSNTKTLSSTIDDQKSEIDNIFTPPLDSDIATLWTRYIWQGTSQNIIHNLTTSEISTQSITTKDSIDTDSTQIYTNNHITDIIQKQ